MKKKLTVIFTAALSVMLVIFALAGCSSQEYVKLSGKFDESKVKSTAESVVGLINSEDYQKITDTMTSEKLKKDLSADILKKVAAQTLSAAGDFQSFASETVSGVQDSKTKQEFAMEVIIAQYKNKKVQYTLSFDTDLKLIGFYMK